MYVVHFVHAKHVFFAVCITVHTYMYRAAAALRMYIVRIRLGTSSKCKEKKNVAKKLLQSK